MVSKSQEKREAVMKRAAESKPKPTAALPPDYSVINGLSKTKLPDIANRIVEIAVEMAKLKKEADDLKTTGVTALLKAGVKSVMVGDIRVTQTGGTSRNIIKRDLLLKFGVSMKVIAKATVPSKKSEYSLKVTAPGEKQGDGDGQQEDE